VPWVTPTDLVANAVAADGRRTVGILGTKLVMHSSTYQTPLGMRGVALLAPDEHDAEALEQIIFGELLSGHIRAESRYLVSRAIETLASRGCEAIILALSEGSMLLSPDGDGVGHSALPVYDASALLAEACVARALPV
jgi:aspartate racemase